MGIFLPENFLVVVFTLPVLTPSLLSSVDDLSLDIGRCPYVVTCLVNPS